jgi:NADPH:quinone reductase-like Zn-dependent oxidoreductase
MRLYTIESFSQDLGGIRRTERDTPRPGPGQALVRMRATTLNYRDLIVAYGLYPPPFVISTGLVPLSDGAGEVVEIGPGVTRVAAGDRVVAAYNQHWLGGPVKLVRSGGDLGGGQDGVLAEYVIFQEEGLVRLPDSIGFTEAAALPCAGVTAWTSLTDGDPLRPGDTVLVQGTGGVSIFALQLARLLGARVIATTSTDEKSELLRTLGADAVISYVRTPDWGAEVRALTEGIGVDRVIEVGGPDTFGQSIIATRRGGTIAMVGVVSGFEAAINPIQLLVGQISTLSISVGSRTDLELLVRAIAGGRLTPVIDRVFPFDEALMAYHHLRDRKHKGKIAISIDDQ